MTARPEVGKKRRRSRRSARPLKRFSILRLLALLVVWGGFAGSGLAYHFYAYFAAELPPDLTKLRDEPTLATLVYSADGELVGEFYLQKRIPVPLERIPERVRNAFIAAEDGRFWQHPGFDIFGIGRAVWTNVHTGAPSQGASTITQQVTRMILLSNEKTVDRKIKELILSVRVERELTKRDILEIYLNRVYLGSGAYGVAAAAETYFGKDVDDLTIAEASLLAGLVQRPADYSPLHNLKAARRRQKYVLGRMQEDGYITAGQAQAALAEPLALVGDDVPLNHVAAPYFVEHVRQWAEKRFGEAALFDGGLRIYTTLDMRMQRSAEAALRDGLENVDRMVGFRGPLGHVEGAALAKLRTEPPRPYVAGLDSAVKGAGSDLLGDVAYVGAVIDLPGPAGVTLAVGEHSYPMVKEDAHHLRTWRGEPGADKRRPTLLVGDLVPVRLRENEQGEAELALAQAPEVQGAFMAMDPHTGRIKAMVGGYDFRQNQFNRATQAYRQIGSAIKPFIYATAMMHGVSALDIVQDAPIAVPTASGIWAPHNFDGKYLGNVTLRTALAKSLNTVAVRLILKVGVEAVIETMRSMGVRAAIPHHISIALGTADLTLDEVVSAYSAFPNGGKLVESQDGLPDELPGQFVLLVTRADGTPIADYRRRLPTRQAISPELAYLMVDLMKAPVERGTAVKARELGRPAAGKTGTATEFRIAWFVGYTADLIAGVWVGRDDNKPIGFRATGGTAALPIWLQFMKAAHPETPVRDFPVPPGVTLVRANELTGQPLGPGAPGARWVPFARGTVPARFAQAIHAGKFVATDFVPDGPLAKPGKGPAGPDGPAPDPGEGEP